MSLVTAPRSGIGSGPGSQLWFDDIDRRISAIEHRELFVANPIENFTVSASATTDGAQIAFDLAVIAGISMVQVLRNFSRDRGSAKVLASWTAQQVGLRRTMSFSDSDPELAGKTAYYWIEAIPYNPALPALYQGPQTLAAAQADLVPPDSLLAVDFSQSAKSGTSVTIGCSFAPPNETRFGSVKIYAKNYMGVATAVAVAQAQNDPMSFQMEATGENVTLIAVSVNKAGIEAALGTGLTAAMTLNGVETDPCEIMGIAATAIASGVQITFPAGPETTITSYQIWRAALGAGFGAAVQIGTIAPTGAASYTYLDAAGLGGQYEWYVIAVNAVGRSNPSAAATTMAVTTSANLPANVPENNQNFATVDSIDAGASATVRIYGAGGVGTSWTRQTGYGTQTLPYGTIASLAYSTVYYIIWNGSGYVAETSFPNALADNYIWAGKVTTVAAGGGGGVSGGGGATGSSAGGRLAP